MQAFGIVEKQKDMPLFQRVRLAIHRNRNIHLARTCQACRQEHVDLVKTGERAYCAVGEWDSFQSIVAARPKMIAMLDKFRDTLEDQGGGLGVTDPVSGEAVFEAPGR